VGIDDEGLRVAVYEALARTGRAPSVGELAATLGADASAVRAAVRRLAAAHHLVLDDQAAILMAHPFAAVPLGFSVMGRATLWWGGCAWDSFALPHLLPEEPEVLVATRCPACGAALAWVVGRDAPPSGDEVAHFLVPVARMWDDVLRTCGNQRLFCDGACVDAWLADAGETKGYVMDLATLWRFASHWYDGRLTYGYVRRDPATAQQYFRDCGLVGPFWGV
jgi:Alkylmercury lyase